MFAILQDLNLNTTFINFLGYASCEKQVFWNDILKKDAYGDYDKSGYAAEQDYDLNAEDMVEILMNSMRDQKF
nr:hypothetical protein [Tanacetum cinerariifolium]